MDVVALTAFLAPVLSHLLAGTADAAGKAAEKVGASAWDAAVSLWHRLSGSVEERPAAAEAAQDVAADPEDPQAQAALAWQLKKVLSADPELLADVTRLWERTVAAAPGITVTASGERSVAVGGNASGSIVTGDATAGARPEPPGN